VFLNGPALSLWFGWARNLHYSTVDLYMPFIAGVIRASQIVAHPRCRTRKACPVQPFGNDKSCAAQKMPTVNDVRHTHRTVGEFTIKSLTQFSAKSSFDFWNARFSVSQRSGRIVGYREAGRNWANNRLCGDPPATPNLLQEEVSTSDLPISCQLRILNSLWTRRSVPEILPSQSLGQE